MPKPWQLFLGKRASHKALRELFLNLILGLNPAVSGDTIRVILPDLTEETRRDFIKKAKSEAENAKVSIRNSRRDGNSQLKDFLKEKEISQDEERQGEEEIQKLTDLYVSKVEVLLQAKRD